MRIGEICTLHAIHCQRDTSVQQAALMMRQHHVGDLVVAEQPNGERVPVGILTDRDIVISVIALGLDPASLLVGDIMSAQLLTASEDEDAYDIIERMRANGIRRLPVVSSLGGLCGIVSIDDLLAFLAQEMAELARVSSGQLAHEKLARK
ncbi:CBS domain-containing protein [Janthinobacterium sp. SUN118]|uniref:CBS domain-containing protein n=1 Tax=Janthinobacterium sp. SUN118 TaxID=3004100 RepID=UPI0025B05592|nr:CBS domain-containing protein [Janthinobacterium sp. SUN118]MDN2711808.1 CBS domain-containing protein [Janthinobacterium sp. SUN118]